MMNFKRAELKDADILYEETLVRKILINEEDPNFPEAIRLMNELSDILETITGDSGKNSFEAKDICGERAVFIIARNQAGEAIGCGALRPIDENTAEVKRMFAKCKGSGVGTQLLAYLETKAQELGYSQLWLETRLINQSAVDFYGSRGYYCIPNYGKYVSRPEAVCFEKKLLK